MFFTESRFNSVGADSVNVGDMLAKQIKKKSVKFGGGIVLWQTMFSATVIGALIHFHNN